MQNEYLNESLQELELITRKVQTEFSRLTPAQLNWKPAPEKWSIAQCLDHLIKTNEQYFPLLKNVANGTYRKSFFASLPGLPGFFGKMMLKALDPANEKKRQAPAAFRPAVSDLSPSIVNDFVRHQQNLSRLIQTTEQVDHEKTIISSPISALITFRLKDGIRIIMVHEERHFMQAKRLLRTPGFPGYVPEAEEPNRRPIVAARQPGQRNQRSEQSNRRQDQSGRRTDQSNRKSDQTNPRTDQPNQRREQPNPKPDQRNQKPNQGHRRPDQENQNPEKSNRRPGQEGQQPQANRKPEQSGQRPQQVNRRPEQSGQNPEQSGPKSESAKPRRSGRRPGQGNRQPDQPTPPAE